MFGCHIVKGSFIEEKNQYTIGTHFSSVLCMCVSLSVFPLECKFHEKGFFPGLLLYF